MSLEIGVLGSSSRVEAYSDAVFSIVSTVMILPVTHTQIPDNIVLSDFLWSKVPLFTVYVYSFYLVASVWSIHVMLFDTIEKADDTLILLNLCLMMATTFLPFSFCLTGEYPTDFYSILLYCGCTIAVMIFLAFMILYAFKVPGIQPIDFIVNPDRSRRRNMMFLHVIVPLVLCLIAILIALVSPGLAASLFLLCIVLNVLIARLIGKAIERCRRRTNLTETVPALYQTKRVGKERVECFSDGVFAIVATILILDLCEDVTKAKDGVDVRMLLGEMSTTIFAYFGSFISIALLWFIHHSTLHCLKEFDRAMSFFNTLCLASVGFFPFAYKIIDKYDSFEGVDFENARVAIQLTAVASFVAGLSQSVIWVIALQKPHKYLHSEASYGGKFHVYCTLKLVIFPIFSLIIFFAAFYLEHFSAKDFYIVQFVTPCIFIGLRLLDLLIVNIRKRIKLSREARSHSMVACDNLGIQDNEDDDITM